MKGIFKGIAPALLRTALLAVSILISNGATPKEIWSNTHHYGQGNHGRRVAVDARGDVVFLWNSHTNSFLVKYSGGSSAMLWQRQWVADLSGMALDQNGNILLSGTAQRFISENRSTNIYTAKCSGASGEILWEKFETRGEPIRYGDGEFMVDPAGNAVLLTAFHTATSTNIQVLEYAAADGTLRWEASIGVATNYEERIFSVALSSGGDVTVGRNFGGESYLWKLADNDGAILWKAQLPRAETNKQVYAYGLTFDPAGNVALTGGSSWKTGDTGRIYTAKFNGDTGALLWEMQHSTPRRPADGVYVTSTPAGDILTTGVAAVGDNQHVDVYIARYAAAQGALIWENTYAVPPLSPAVASDEPAGVVLDHEGNIILGIRAAAYTLLGPRSSTLKIDAANGQVLWEVIHTNAYTYSFAYGAGDIVALAGQLRINNEISRYEALLSVFSGAPALTTRLAPPGEFEITWPAEAIGWSLKKLNSTLGHPAAQWIAVPHPTNGNSLRIPLHDQTALFRLFRE